MGRLAGFRYREVAQRLRVFGFRFDRPGAGSHEVGVMRRQAEKLPSRIIPAIWRKGRCERFYAKLELALTAF